jgi:hypothetical protein
MDMIENLNISYRILGMMSFWRCERVA